MTDIQINIAVGILGALITAAVIVHLIIHCKIFERKAVLQEELSSIYTPDILKGKVNDLSEDPSFDTTPEKVEDKETDGDIAS